MRKVCSGFEYMCQFPIIAEEGLTVKFLDCDLSYGKYIKGGPYSPCPSISELRSEINRAEISGGLVYNVAADVGGVVAGNTLLQEDMVEDDELYGVFTLLPSFTHEIPSPGELPHIMAKTKMRALRLNPEAHKYLAHASVLADYFSMAQIRHIPVIFDTSCGITLDKIDNLMSAFPMLTAILTYTNVWPSGRYLRPFLHNYANLCLNTAYMIDDQGFEALIREFGSTRLLFGSHFPSCYLGAQMLNIRHADISAADKALIAGGNLMRLMKEADLS